MKPYNAECADPMSGNLVWLGIKSKNYIWYKINYDKTLAVQKFLNWKVTAPYFKNYECGFATVNKTWDSDTNCHKKVKMCTVCKLSGKWNILIPSPFISDTSLFQEILFSC